MSVLGPTAGLCRLASGLSGHPDPSRAAEQVCAQCFTDLAGSPASVAFVFLSAHHTPAAQYIARLVQRELDAACVIGVTAESVLGGRTELERTPGLSVLAARLPGVRLRPFTGDDLQPFDAESPAGLAHLADRFGAGPEHRATFLFADPFSVPMIGLLPALSRARNAAARAAGQGAALGPILGGMASGATSAGGNALVLNGSVYTSGLVGVSLAGPVRVDAVVAQGCRPFGPTMVVTGARRNMILSLGGRRAIDAVREAIMVLPDDDRAKLEKGLFIGRVVNEYKDRFGRGDFLVRNIMGIDEGTGGIAAGDIVRVGQTVQLHLRDAKTADEDLALLLDAQQLHAPPLGALLVTCNGRGTRLFDQPHHDAAAFARAFAPGRSGEDLAKAGSPIPTGEAALPLAGFFGAGEIGPVGDESFVHGHTVCAGVFRAAT